MITEHQIPETIEERREWIKYQLGIRGTSLAALALKHRVSRQLYSITLVKPNKIRELHIAAELGVKPELIWPERYS